MKLIVTTHDRFYKGPDGLYYSTSVYDYNFFLRYLRVFNEIRVVAHVERIEADKTKSMLLVSGPNLEVYELPFPHGKWNYIKSIWAIQRKIRKCYNGCDAAVLRIPDVMAFQVFFVLTRKRFPVAVEVVADPLELFSANGGKYPLRLFLKWFEYWSQRKCCQKADGVSYVTNNHLQAVYPARISYDSNRFETHYTSAGIDKHEFLKRDYPIKRTIKLIHVSTSISGKIKGHKELIEAFVKLRKNGYDINLTLVGGGALDIDINEFLLHSREKDNVILAGILNKEELEQQYKNADIFVFPSYREGLPRVVIEAMSWGLPCVASDIPGCRELLNANVLAKVGDADALTAVLRELLDNPTIMEEESERNYRESEAYFSDVVNNTRDDFYGKLKRIAEDKV